MATELLTTAFSPVSVSLDEPGLREYQAQEDLLQVQPASIQRALELQASLIARTVLERQSPLRFMLPEQVALDVDGHGDPSLVTVPPYNREQKIGGILDLLKDSDLSYHLKRLEASPDGAVSTCGRLIRHTVVRHLVHRMLPLPQRNSDNQRLLSAYALDFFMPQWVAFDDQDNLLVNTIDEARACITGMQQYLSILKLAARLAAYIIHDEAYQRKRYAMLAQLLNQGHALARHETSSIIWRLKQRVAENSLNRGFDLDLPFFDEQALELRTLTIPVIPHGRIPFVPAFFVIALRGKQMEVEHSTGLSHTTRKHILDELKALQAAFDSPSK